MKSTTNLLAGAGDAVAPAAATAPPVAMDIGDPSGSLVDGACDGDPRAALLRLVALGDRMAAVRRRIAASMSGESEPLSSADIHSVSSEISSAAHLVVLNAASLLSSAIPFRAPSPSPPPPPPAPVQELPPVVPVPQELSQEAAKGDGDYDVVELDASELLAEHVHFCDICGKGFRRDANLRMHMRAHGDRFKTLDALSRPGQPKQPAGREVRFSCPYAGCNRNRAHRRFRPLKSAVCARNHFRRSHCPKLYACERCGGKKRFAVLADLRSHLRHCGEEAQWRCSCGTTFSRKDKLFGHLALFEGHKPAIAEPNKGVVTAPAEASSISMMEEGGVDANCDREEDDEGGFDPEFFQEWMEELRGGAVTPNWSGPSEVGH
ncbi:protein EARLY HEADING DATE 2-like [Oryza brachyantha]|uniref:protein EARLY HEADING DATE 2-like n=1 Tax=Oryza brachyantha TaxID=4533 RepID=UPI001ADC087F|nr:protein EARLY HEADING DATE 2-like [Oryza brachyantha]